MFFFSFPQNGTVDLIAYDEKNLGGAINNYNKLFENLYTCGNAFKSVPMASFIFVMLCLTAITNRFL